MAFNLDDPLADILSDGSNDSFFGVGPNKKNKPVTQSTPKPSMLGTSSTGNFDDLFGIQEAKPKTIENVSKPYEPSFSKTKQEEQPKPPLIAMTKPTTSFNDDDLISDLGFDPKKPKNMKTNILDDILGSVEPKKTSAGAARPHTSGGILKDESRLFSRQSTETTESTVAGASASSFARPKTSAGPRQSIASSNDPLGLFSISTKENIQPKEAKETPKTIRRKGTTADWLGLEPEAEKEKDLTPPEPQHQTQPQVMTVHDTIPTTTQTVPQIPFSTFNPNSNNLLLTASTLESQNTMQALQQQETQILLAAQMKNQEMALLEMQQRQQQLLTQQETQFNSLVQKQLARQNQLEATIRAQHERINAHIQMLMSQPHVTPGLVGDENDDFGGVHKSKETTNKQQEIEDVELRAEVKRLELEKLRLEDLVANVNANHEKEIEFMENSHKKQIQVIEDNYQSIETRLKQEIKNIEDHYSKKLDTLESEKLNLISTYESKLKDMADEHENALKKVKDHYNNELEAMRQEHKTMIDNIRQSKFLEFAVVQENTSYLQTLKNASNNLENVSGNLQGLRDELYSRIEVAHKEQQVKLEAREKVVEDRERHLKIIEETTEQERNRLMNLVSTLEQQLTTLTKETSEEQWVLRQKISTLEVERSAFEKEKQFAKEQLQREEKRIDELKQLQLDEQQRLMQQIQDEKQHIAVEKAKLEAAKKLQANSNNEQLKYEAEAALKVAQDAARQADQERERYLGMQRNLEVLKRELVDQENELRQKQDELESMVYTARAKERQVQDALQKTRHAEQNYVSRLQVLQTQLRQTSQREAELSQDRLGLARQRFELQEFKKRLEMSKCSLCQIGEKSNELSQILTRDHQMDPGRIPANLDAPPSNVNYGYSGYPSNAIDRLFDTDLTESLRRMQMKNTGLGLTADFDYGFLDQLPQRSIETRLHTVPTQTVDIDLPETSANVQNDVENE